MAMNPSEATKEIVIAAIQNGYIGKETQPNKSVEEVTAINAKAISDFYNVIFKTISNA